MEEIKKEYTEKEIKNINEKKKNISKLKSQEKGEIERGGEFKIVKISKFVKVWKKESFNFKDKITTLNKTNKNGRKLYDLSSVVKVDCKSNVNDEDPISVKDMAEIADKNNYVGLHPIDLSFRGSSFKWKKTYIMPENEIKDEYIEGYGLEELSNSMYSAIEVHKAFIDKKKEEIHVLGCRCNKCTKRRNTENSDSEEDLEYYNEEEEEEESDSYSDIP